MEEQLKSQNGTMKNGDFLSNPPGQKFLKNIFSFRPGGSLRSENFLKKSFTLGVIEGGGVLWKM